MADGFRLTALFGIDAGESTRRIDEGEHRQVEFFSDFHQSQGLAITLGLGHAEVAHRALFGVAALLVANDHAGLAIEACKTADDGLIVRIAAVAMQFMEVGEDLVHVIHRVRTLRMACNLRDLPGRELRVDILGQLLALLREAVDLFGDVDGGVFLHEAQFFNLGLQLGNRLLEAEEGGFAHGNSLLSWQHRAARGCRRQG